MSDISIEELRENFDFYDKDGDGKLGREEFAGLMETIKPWRTGPDGEVFWVRPRNGAQRLLRIVATDDEKITFRSTMASDPTRTIIF